jgi:hypothetical protein
MALALKVQEAGFACRRSELFLAGIKCVFNQQLLTCEAALTRRLVFL